MAFPMDFEGSEARQHPIQLFVGALWQDHHECVAVETNRKVGAANDGTYARAEFAQDLISGVATEALVDEAELFEIEQDEREWMTHALCACNFGGEALLCETTIVETGERIEHRQIAEAVELRLLVGKVGAQLLDQKFLTDRVDVEKNDQRDESEYGFGEADFEESAGALVGGHGSERDDRADHQKADEDGVAAERGVALLDQRQFLLELVLAGIERGGDKIEIRITHVWDGAEPHVGQIRGTKMRGQWNFGLKANYAIPA